jgi:ribosomal-protein-alanine N-acetyltransferase
MTASRVQLRRAVASDIDEVVALERATGNAPHWPPAAYAAILGSAAQQRCLIVARTDEVMTGFAVGLIHPVASDSASRTAELESVVVAVHARRAGLGRSLCAAVIDWCRSQHASELILEVRAAGAGAIALYTSLGFTPTGRRPRYYRDPEDDALAMRLQLP